MAPSPDCGEQTYTGSGRLTGKVALITGADNGIGRAVALAFAREDADVAVAYLEEHEDARETARWVEQAGRQCLLLPGDLAQMEVCQDIVLLASDEGSYISGSRYGVTGGKPIL